MKAINKDGTVNKAFSKKLWNHANKAFCDSFNDEITDDGFQERFEQFTEMLNELISLEPEEK